MILSTMWLLLATGSMLVGCSYIAMSQKRNSHLYFGNADPRGRRGTTRVLGWGLLTMGFVFCVVRDGAGFGVLSWTLILGVMSLAITMLLAYRPDWLRLLL